MSEAHLTMGAHSAPPMEARPFAIPSKKLAMWLFIMSDVMTFAACVAAYAFLRNATPDWPRPFHSVTNVAVMTVIMLTSSLTMLMAVGAAKMADKAKAFRWMMITAAGGILFTLLHIRDWMGMIDQGVGAVSKIPGGQQPLELRSIASPGLACCTSRSVRLL